MHMVDLLCMRGRYTSPAIYGRGARLFPWFPIVISRGVIPCAAKQFRKELRKEEEIMAHNFKRFLTLLFAAVVMVSLLATTAFAAEVSDIVFDENPVCYTHGDANNDGKITQDDAFYILYSYLWGDAYPITHKATADVDGNNSVNTKDAIYTLYAVVLPDESHPLNNNVHEYYTPFWSWG